MVIEKELSEKVADDKKKHENLPSIQSYNCMTIIRGLQKSAHHVQLGPDVNFCLPRHGRILGGSGGWGAGGMTPHGKSQVAMFP